MLCSSYHLAALRRSFTSISRHAKPVTVTPSYHRTLTFPNTVRYLHVSTSANNATAQDNSSGPTPELGAGPTGKGRTRSYLIAYFAKKYPEFEYDWSKPCMDEFWRLVDTMGFSRKGKRYRRARAGLKAALILEFHEIYGTGGENVDIKALHNFLTILGVEGPPEEPEVCLQRLKSIHVNLCDVVDSPVTNVKIKPFSSEEELSVYSLATQKIFPLVDEAEEQVLGRLIRNLQHPSSKKKKTKTLQQDVQSPGSQA